MKNARKLIILDRDGVVNSDSKNYIKTPDEWIPIPRSLSAISCLNKLGYAVVVATNQSGIARGYYSLETLEAIHRKMQEELVKVEGHIERIYFCPHAPDADCACRKPNPGLLYTISQDFPKAFPDDATLVGDSLRDIQAAQEAGCGAVLVKTGNGRKTIASNKGLDWIPIFEDLSDYVSRLTLKSV